MPLERLDRTFGRAVCIGLLAILGAAPGEEARPLAVRAQLSMGPYYVGQEIALEVGVVAEAERPRVVPPRVAGAEVTAVGTDLRPIATSGIGAAVFERNLFLTRFRVVPRRAGALTIPPVMARLGNRTGASETIRLTVRDLPAAGRPAAFLGGVGPFEVTAEASPATVRVGQTFEYRVRVAGPAARGMTRIPEIAGRAPFTSGWRVEPGPVDEVDDAPSRVFRYRVRPTRAGEVVLPPVAIASFDPGSARYVTRVSPGVPVRVVDVPSFDPRTLDYAAPTDRSPAATRRAVVGVIVAASLGAAALVAWWVSRPWHARRAAEGEARRLVARVRGELDPSRDAAELGRRITEGLAEYLHATIGRPRGALTPAEAHRGIALAARDDRLADGAARLVALCDRAQYAGDRASSIELVGHAGEWLDELAKAEVGPGRRPFETPREAVETATS